MEILALHPGALGDIILSLPALSLLKVKLADVRLTLAGNLDYLEIVPECLADRRLSLSSLPLQRLYGTSPLPEADMRLWTSFDRIVSWTGFSEPQFAARLRSIYPEALISDWKPRTAERRHASQIFADSLAPWIGIQEIKGFVRISPRTSCASYAADWLTARGCDDGTSIIALQPGAGSESKRWPLSSFVEVALALEQTLSGRILIIEGPAEPGLGDELAGMMKHSREMVAKCLSLECLAALLSRCRTFVGNDSGISHLAASTGIPCVVLFGATSPDHWSPLGSRVTILNKSHIEEITPQDVLQALI